MVDSRTSPGDSVGLDTICLAGGLDRSTDMVGFDSVGFDLVGFDSVGSSSSSKEGVGLEDAHGGGVLSCCWDPLLLVLIK